MPSRMSNVLWASVHSELNWHFRAGRQTHGLDLNQIILTSSVSASALWLTSLCLFSTPIIYSEPVLSVVHAHVSCDFFLSVCTDSLSVFVSLIKNVPSSCILSYCSGLLLVVPETGCSERRSCKIFFWWNCHPPCTSAQCVSEKCQPHPTRYDIINTCFHTGTELAWEVVHVTHEFVCQPQPLTSPSPHWSATSGILPHCFKKS